jgi:hypothetical protein
MAAPEWIIKCCNCPGVIPCAARSRLILRRTNCARCSAYARLPASSGTGVIVALHLCSSAPIETRHDGYSARRTWCRVPVEDICSAHLVRMPILSVIDEPEVELELP